jgi:hypothetical protein
MRAALLLALCLVGAPARAQEDEKLDLRRLGTQFRPAVGDRVRTEDRQTQRMRMTLERDGDVVQRREQDEGVEETYVDETLELAEDGKPGRVVRTYERFVDAADGEAAPPGIRVLLTHGPGGDDFQVMDGSPALPPALEARLVKERDKLNAVDGERHAAKRDMMAAMVPDGLVAIGERWTIDPLRVAPAMGLSAEDRSIEDSRCEGQLTLGAPRGEARWVRLSVRLRLALRSMRNLQFEAVTPFEMTVEAEAPADGTSPGMELTGTGSFEGVMRVARAPGARAIIGASMEMSRRTRLVETAR